MARINVRKALVVAAVAAAASLTVAGVSIARPDVYGMGPEMMAGYGPGASCHGGYDLDLTAEQRSKLASLQNELARKQFERMTALHDERFKLRDLYAAPQRDDDAIGASRERLGKLQREMHQAALEGRKAFEAVLTPEQREEARRGWVGAHMF